MGPPEAPRATDLPEASGAPSEPRFEQAWSGPAGEAPWKRVLRALSLAGETAAAFALRPARSFERFRAEGGAAAPIVYGTIVGGPCLLIGTVEKSLLPPFAGAAGSDLRLSAPAALAVLLAAPGIYIYVRAQALHLTLVLTGRARGSFTATLRVAGYSSGSVAPLLLIPFAGDFLFLAAGAVVEAIGIRFVHGLSPLDAAVIEAIPASVLALGLLAALLVGMIWWSQARG